MRSSAAISAPPSCRSMPPGRGRVHVIECSSYQIDLAPSLDPSIGILINLSEDHLDRHGSMEHYASVKERLVAGVPATRHRDRRRRRRLVPGDRGAARWAWSTASCRVSVRRETGGWRLRRAASEILRAGGAVQSPTFGGIGSLRGLHNAQNAACAAAAALALGLDPAAIQAGLRSFPGLAHRMEEVGRRGKVLFVNDSKATNANSAAQALACFGDIYWIAGGKPKTGGIEVVAEILSAHPQGLSDRRSGRGIRRDARQRRAPRDHRHARQGRGGGGAGRRSIDGARSRSCCCRPLAPRSTSTAISRSAATPSVPWCGRCRAIKVRILIPWKPSRCHH